MSPATRRHRPQGHAIVLPPDPVAVREARSFVSRHCREAEVSEDCEDVVLLMTSEVVTNVVRHARVDAVLTVCADEGKIRVQVADNGPDLLVQRAPDDEDPGGRGLRIVERLAGAWGVERFDSGKAVWFQVTYR